VTIEFQAMDSHQIKQHLTDLVLDGREEVAIEELLAMSSSRNKAIRDNIAALSSRYQHFEREKTRGSLSKENIHTTSGRISHALMSIIEQLTEEEETDLQSVDLEELFKEIDELSVNEKTASKRRLNKTRSIKMFSILLPVFIVVILGILAFNGTFSSTTTPGASALNIWKGEWQHEMESANESKITGKLSFEIVNDSELAGKAQSVFPDGSQTIYTLSQIVFSSNGKVIDGNWKADDIQSLHGTFSFSLNGENQFEGHYTVVNQTGEFYWNGTK
jgi:Effector-associated domain 11